MTKRTEQHLVRITKSMGEERRDELIAFINGHIVEYKGKTEDRVENRHGIPLMVFDRQSDAHVFAKEISKRLDFPREHIEVVPRKEEVNLNRPDAVRQKERAGGPGPAAGNQPQGT